jgi:hypothetical protein
MSQADKAPPYSVLAGDAYVQLYGRESTTGCG